MRLLPDIYLCGHKISMQLPYTIDNEIITNISYLSGGQIKLNDITIIEAELKRKFDVNYIAYLTQNNHIHIYEDYDGLYRSLGYEGYSGYINEIFVQCNNISLSSDYYNQLCATLSNRRRCLSSNQLLNSNEVMHYSNRATAELYTSSRGQRSNVVYDFTPCFTTEAAYTNSAAISNNSKKYVHEYNYIPKFIHYYMPNEKKSETILLGAEIEVGGNKNTDLNKEDVVKKCIQIMNDSESTEENYIYSTHDSTVQIELDTMPCSLEYHKQKMRYKELFKYLDSVGYKGHDCNSAGLHVHVNRSYLGSTPLLQQLTISKILYILEKFNQHICVIARRDNEYSKFIGEKENEKSVVELYSKYKSYGKRSALNLRHPNTIEFRMFKSTLKYETFIVTLEFVKDIVDYAKSINVEDIEGIKWKDLFNTFSIELKSYYNSRLRKIKNKNIDNNIEELKKKISYLKKQLNHCTSYMETKRIRNELSNAEKELAKYKNKIRKENKKKEFNVNTVWGERPVFTFVNSQNITQVTCADLIVDSRYNTVDSRCDTSSWHVGNDGN